MNRAEIIKAGEKLARALAKEGWVKDVETIRSLIALVPKDGEVVVPEEPN